MCKSLACENLFYCLFIAIYVSRVKCKCATPETAVIAMVWKTEAVDWSVCIG